MGLGKSSALSAAILALYLSGCAVLYPSTSAPELLVNVPGAGNAKWAVSAKSDSGVPPLVTIYVNGTAVAKQPAISSVAKGDYQGHSVQGMCPFPVKKCDIYIDGTLSATLYFGSD